MDPNFNLDHNPNPTTVTRILFIFFEAVFSTFLCTIFLVPNAHSPMAFSPCPHQTSHVFAVNLIILKHFLTFLTKIMSFSPHFDLNLLPVTDESVVNANKFCYHQHNVILIYETTTTTLINREGWLHCYTSCYFLLPKLKE